MANLGAEVIKIEVLAGGDLNRTSGEMKGGISSFFETNDRGVKSATLTLKDGEGQAILCDLVKTAGVVGQNFQPSAEDKSEFSPENLKKVNSGLIYVAILGFGASGPKPIGQVRRNFYRAR